MSGPWGYLEGVRPVKLMRKLITEGADNPIEMFVQLYGATQEKAILAYETAVQENTALKNVSDDSIGLYIGIPFCKTRCLYCSFTTEAMVRNTEILAKYLECLSAEIEYIATHLDTSKIVTLYIGGGTPTFLEAAQLHALVMQLKLAFPKTVEFTVEAGRPDSITKDKLDVLKALGVDRICINPQTMNNTVLKNIGRPHTAEDIMEKYWLSRKVGFKTINMDLIAGLPGDTYDSFCNSIDKLVELTPENVTIHTLSIKRGSRLNENVISFNDDHTPLIGEMLVYASQQLKAFEYKEYYLYRQKKMFGNFENTGYALEGHTNIYNIIMMEETHNVIALGAGGVSRILRKKNCNNTEKKNSKYEKDIERFFNYKEPQLYIEDFQEIINRKTCLLSLINEIRK